MKIKNLLSKNISSTMIKRQSTVDLNLTKTEKSVDKSMEARKAEIEKDVVALKD